MRVLSKIMNKIKVIKKNSSTEPKELEKKRKKLTPINQNGEINSSTSKNFFTNKIHSISFVQEHSLQ